MTRTALLTMILAGLLVNLTLMAANRSTTEEARAQDGTLRVALTDGGGGNNLSTASKKLADMVDLIQNMDRNTRQITLLSTNSAPDVEAATKKELATLQQILEELQRSRPSSTGTR